MDPLRNEVDPSDQTDHGAKPPMAFTIAALAGLHLLCCGLPLLLLSGVSLATIVPRSPIIGAIFAVLGLAGFVWYLKKGCATCPGKSSQCRVGKSGSRPKLPSDFLASENDSRTGKSI